jgi:hypothetical protein
MHEALRRDSACDKKAAIAAAEMHERLRKEAARDKAAAILAAAMHAELRDRAAQRQLPAADLAVEFNELYRADSSRSVTFAARLALCSHSCGTASIL